jgi:hypothetical protein
MAEKDSKNFPTLGLMATAAAIGGAIVFTQVPLEVPRPGGSQGLSYRDRSVQDVDARLWEDPFAAVSRELRGVSKDAAAVADTRVRPAWPYPPPPPHLSTRRAGARSARGNSGRDRSVRCAKSHTSRVRHAHAAVVDARYSLRARRGEGS